MACRLRYRASNSRERAVHLGMPPSMSIRFPTFTMTLCLALLPIAAQAQKNSAISPRASSATGESGCYFGECGDGSSAPPPPRVPVPSPERNRTPEVSNTGDGWFVILGSFPSQAEAIGRRSALQARGVSAKIVNSNKYRNFTSGYYVVVLGPYDRAKALTSLSRVKGAVSDAYIKSSN
jgi:cell division protein FtsN